MCTVHELGRFRRTLSANFLTKTHTHFTHTYTYTYKDIACSGEKTNKEVVLPPRRNEDVPIFINTNVRFPFFNENIERKKKSNVQNNISQRRFTYTYGTQIGRVVSFLATKKERKIKRKKTLRDGARICDTDMMLKYDRRIISGSSGNTCLVYVQRGVIVYRKRRRVLRTSLHTENEKTLFFRLVSKSDRRFQRRRVLGGTMYKVSEPFRPRQPIEVIPPEWDQTYYRKPNPFLRQRRKTNWIEEYRITFS